MRQKILVIKAKGGMGNRMLCTACGAFIGTALNREVYVDWRDTTYSEYNENSFFHYFKRGKFLHEMNKYDSVFPEIWTDNLDKCVSEMIDEFFPGTHSSPTIHKKFSIDPKTCFRREDALVFWYYTERFRDFKALTSKSSKEHSKYNLFNIKKDIFKSTFILKDDIQSIITNFKKNNFTKNVLGVHVRYSSIKVDLNRIIRTTEYLLSNKEYNQIFLATDNSDVLKMFCDKFSNVISTSKWYPKTGEIMHQNSNIPNRITNGQEALIDLFLLSLCDGLLYSSRSTFPIAAIYLSDLNHGRCYDLDKYNMVVHGKKILKRFLA